MARRSPVLFFGALALLLGGGVALAASSSPARKPEGEGEPSTPKDKPAGNDQNESQSSTSADELLNERQPDAPKFSWTLSSLALEGAADTYNTDAERKARKLRLASQPGAQLVNAFQQVVYFIANLIYPGAGVALQAIFTAAGALSDNLVNRGGFENLSSLTRKRLLLYGNLAVSARLPPGIVVVQNRNQYRDLRTTEHYRQLMEWYRANLEIQRIVSTPDDAMIPVAYVSFLRSERLWPPPIEPVPLSSAEAKTQYARFPGVLNWISLNPIESYVEDRATADQAFANAMKNYSEQAPDYRDLVATLILPPEVEEVMASFGSWPRVGSAYFPVKSSGGPLSGF